ncbi:MAG: histidine kinase, partial [Cyclobacteriaceae bacterium]|nr:histidine kinase [Cyclobacteriaceae bacterium]
MARLASPSDFYESNTNVKWVMLVVSVLISIGSIYYTDVLVEQLKDRERGQVELFARALEYTLNNESENLMFVTDEIIFKNNSIPTIWITREKEFQYRNIKIRESWSVSRKEAYLQEQVEDMGSLYEPIQMTYRNEAD